MSGSGAEKLTSMVNALDLKETILDDVAGVTETATTASGQQQRQQEQQQQFNLPTSKSYISLLSTASSYSTDSRDDEQEQGAVAATKFSNASRSRNTSSSSLSSAVHWPLSTSAPLSTASSMASSLTDLDAYVTVSKPADPMMNPESPVRLRQQSAAPIPQQQPSEPYASTHQPQQLKVQTATGSGYWGRPGASVPSPLPPMPVPVPSLPPMQVPVAATSATAAIMGTPMTQSPIVVLAPTLQQQQTQQVPTLGRPLIVQIPSPQLQQPYPALAASAGSPQQHPAPPTHTVIAVPTMTGAIPLHISQANSPSHIVTLPRLLPVATPSLQSPVRTVVGLPAPQQQPPFQPLQQQVPQVPQAQYTYGRQRQGTNEGALGVQLQPQHQQHPVPSPMPMVGAAPMTAQEQASYVASLGMMLIPQRRDIFQATSAEHQNGAPAPTDEANTLTPPGFSLLAEPSSIPLFAFPTLPSILAYRAYTTPNHIAFTCVSLAPPSPPQRHSSSSSTSGLTSSVSYASVCITYTTLLSRALRVAQVLTMKSQLGHGDTVALLYRRRHTSSSQSYATYHPHKDKDTNPTSSEDSSNGTNSADYDNSSREDTSTPATSSSDLIEYLVALFGTWLAGMVAVPVATSSLDLRDETREVDFVIRNSGCGVALTTEGNLRRLGKCFGKDG
ncbi:hypothetical protein HK102_003557, partial [Quaeritorhiza haematococci]